MNPSSMQTMLVLMGFELLFLAFMAVIVYLKIIPNDLLILAIGVVIRGALSIIPTVTAITQNTAATKENTQATVEAAGLPVAVVEPLK